VGYHHEKHRTGIMSGVDPVSTSSGVMFFSEEDELLLHTKHVYIKASNHVFDG